MDKQIVECGRCGRKLKSPKAIKLGFGSVCWAKTQAEPKPAEDRPETRKAAVQGD